MIYETRSDAFSSFLSGFEIRTARRCKTIRVESQGTLVRRYELGYELPANDPVEIIAPNDAGLTFSHLRQVTQYDNLEGSSNFLPPLRLGYTRFDVALGTRGTIFNNPVYSLGNANLIFADINTDSLPDLLYTDPLTGQHSVFYNSGDDTFSAETLFTEFPSATTLDNPGTQLADYDGDGRIDLIQKAGGSFDHFVFFPNTTPPVGHDETNPAWGAEQSFAVPHPPFDLDDPSVRTLDLDGDKLIDFFRTTSAGFIYFYNRGDSWEEDGLYLYGEPQLGDLTGADGVEFSKPGPGGTSSSNEQIKLADMNGDRLLDIVRINLFGTRLETTFWPNKGRGFWGNRVTMSGMVDLGVVGIESVFIQDINQDGLSDIVAVGFDNIAFWINQGSNTFSDKFVLSNTPEYIQGTTILQRADINGHSRSLLTRMALLTWGSFALAWLLPRGVASSSCRSSV